MFFGIKPNLSIGRRFLWARFGFVAAYSIAESKKINHLAKRTVKMYRRGAALHEMACLAREMDEPVRVVWLQLCEKLVFYWAEWLSRRTKKLLAQNQRRREKAEALYELLGTKK